MPKYRMLNRGMTEGAVTGHPYVWYSGKIVDAPAGEFAHLAEGSFEEVPEPEPEKEPATAPIQTATAPSAPEKAVAPKARKRR